MEWEKLLQQFSNRPLFHTSMLSVFNEPVANLQVQLTRWKKAGKLSCVKKGWYLINAPYNNAKIPIEYIANQIVHPSYLSMEWALQYYDLIPEYVPAITLVTTQKAVEINFKNTILSYTHIKPDYLMGFNKVKLMNMDVFIATPEKALWDKIYFYCHQSSLSENWLHEMRLQNLDNFNMEVFLEYSKKASGGKLKKASELAHIFLKKKVLEKS